MKQINTFTLLLTAGILVACGGKNSFDSGPGSAANKGDDFSCVYPDNIAAQTEAPAWICRTDAPGYAYVVQGSFRKTAAGIDFQRGQAASSARTALSRNISTDIDSKITRIQTVTSSPEFEGKKLNSNERIALGNSSVVTDITKASLRGSHIIKSAINPKTGHMYVLIGIKQSDFQKSVDESIGKSELSDAVNDAILDSIRPGGSPRSEASPPNPFGKTSPNKRERGA